MNAPITEHAHAKINLSLEVAGRREDSYHHLTSLVAFAQDVFDVVCLDPDLPQTTPGLGRRSPASMTGAMAKPIEGVNIVDRVLERLAADRPELRLGRVRIEKIIPVSAGLGGGSADAAAVLRAVARTNGIADASAEFGAWATPLGADIPVCLGGGGRAAAVMMGVGDVIWRPLDDRALLPREVHAVLVNPDRPVSTATVFRALDADWLRCPPVPRMPKPTFCSFGDLIAWLVASRNDLERPARALVPVIGDVIDAISAQSGCRLARMSGSGATCFGLFETAAGAEHARVAITRAEPAWWARGTRLV